jgi:hypothetical protein
VTVGVEIDPDRIATAVQASRHIASLDSGRYGEIATYLPGRRVSGVRIRPDSVTIGVIGRYPATATEIDAWVRATIGPLDRPLHVYISDLHIGDFHIGDTVAVPDGRAPDPTSPDQSSDPAVVVSAHRVDHTVDRS